MKFSTKIVSLVQFLFLSHYNALKLATTKKSLNFPQKLVQFILNSPLNEPITRIAKDKMKKTALNVGVDWDAKKEMLLSANDWTIDLAAVEREQDESFKVPDYYRAPFHAYEEGNLSLESALEQEIAGKAVGARNFPKDGARGEEVLRSAFQETLLSIGWSVPKGGTILDLGCGTGTSTRRLAKLFPWAKSIQGIDLSPYMIAVGRFLLKRGHTLDWVEPLPPPTRTPHLSLCYGDAGNLTQLKIPPASIDSVTLTLVLHELPALETLNVLAEAQRVLKPGGQLAIVEMDPQAPGYVNLRQSPLFAILRSTEPYLDQYFDVAPALPQWLLDNGFDRVKIGAATGRHFALLARKTVKPNLISNLISNKSDKKYTKGIVEDLRPTQRERILMDQHLTPTQ